MQQSMTKPSNETVSDWYRWVDEISRPVILDGGLGEVLVERGYDLSSGTLWSGHLLVTNPSALRAVAEDWLNAGSEIISTATYQVTLEALGSEHGLSDRDALARIANNCDEIRRVISTIVQKGSISRRIPRIALSLGPLSSMLSDCDEYSSPYSSDMPLQRFIAFHQTRAMQFYAASRADILAFETIGCKVEAVASVQAMAHPKLQNLPFWLSLRCKDESHLAYGEDLKSAITAILLACLSNPTKNLVALGVNCIDVAMTQSLVSTLSEDISIFMKGCSSPWRVDVLAYPNNGQIWVNGDWRWSSAHGKNTPLSTDAWAETVKNCGARMIGGCCRTGPGHIAALSRTAGLGSSSSPKDEGDFKMRT